MVAAYLENDLVQLEELSVDELQAAGTAVSDYFFEAGILARNRRMLDSLLPYLENNSVFVAVGALHLPGEDGLLGLLRKRGYELKPLDIPFPQEQISPRQNSYGSTFTGKFRHQHCQYAGDQQAYTP